MKKYTLRILLLTALLIFSALCHASCSEPLSDEHTQQTIGDKTFTFASEKDKEEWRKPLEKLLANARELDADDYDDPTYKNLPTFWDGYGCALFDVTLDGIPELIVNYGGGTAGNHYYAIFDLYTGADLGSFDADYNDDWRVYYNTDLDLICLMGVYGFREGWDINYTLHGQMVYNAERGEYTSRVLYEAKSIMEELDDDDPIMVYYVADKKVSEAEYTAAMEAYERSYIELEGTKLTFVSWRDLQGEEGEYKARAQEMADLLLSSEQRFLLPETES